jgi:hypothetical protein
MVARNDTALGLFHVLSDQRILVCRICRAGVVPQHLVTHIRAHHQRLYPEFQTKRSPAAWVEIRLLTSLPCELLDLFSGSIPVPSPKTKAFPVLRLHVGYGCAHCSVVSKREEEIRRHYNICHAEVRRGCGGAVANSRGVMQKRLNSDHYGDQPPCQPAFYQRFFTAGVKGSICFRVEATEKKPEDKTLQQQGSMSRSNEGDFVMDPIFGALAQLETAQSRQQLALDTEPASPQVSLIYLTRRANLDITEISDNSPDSNPGSAVLLIRSFLNSSKQLERSGFQSLDVLSSTIERADR